MARKEALKYQINNSLREKIAFRQSKHKDKEGMGFGESSLKIYSYGAYDTYKKECLQYGKWLTEKKGLDKFTRLEETKQYVEEYLQERVDAGCSVYTVKMERSALGMLYGERIEYALPDRTFDKITRSRNESNEKHYSRNGKYKDVFSLGLGTGGRRADLLSLTKESFFEKDGMLFVHFHQSKGGRDRITYVREEYRERIEELLKNKEPDEKLIRTIPKHIDIHSLRREYVRELYNDIKDDKALRNDILKNYPERHEFKTQKDKNGKSYTKEIQSTIYKDRDGHVFERDDVYVFSQCLGHNRLDVSVTHYLK